MKTISIICTFTFLSIFSAFAEHHSGEKATFRHIVCFKFKKETTPEQIKMVEQEFAKLPSKIKTIKGYEWGTSLGDAAQAKGFTHCFTISFKNKAGLDVYGPHPDHQAFVKIIKPLLEDLFVFDYIAE